MTKDEALKQALEALRMPCNYWNKTQFIKVQEAIAVAEEALAQPAQRKPLTHEQIEAIFQESAGADEGTVERFARAIEFAHGIKENT